MTGTGFGTDVHDGKEFSFFHDSDRNMCKDGKEHKWSDCFRDDGVGGQGRYCEVCDIDIIETILWE